MSSNASRAAGQIDCTFTLEPGRTSSIPSPMTKERPKYQAPALAKGLDILELLASTGDAMSMVDIAKSLSRSKSEIFRMLIELEKRGYIRRDDESDRFTITKRLFDLAMRVPPTRNLVAVALPHMESVARTLDQSTHLAVLSGLHIVVISRVEAPGELGFAVRIGYRQRVDQSTSGTILTAFASPREREKILEGLREEVGDFDEAYFQRTLKRVAAQGFLKAPSPVVKGITDIGAPILGENGYAAAALTIPFIARENDPYDAGDVSKLLVKTARKISVELMVTDPQDIDAAQGFAPGPNGKMQP